MTKWTLFRPSPFLARDLEGDRVEMVEGHLLVFVSYQTESPYPSERMVAAFAPGTWHSLVIVTEEASDATI